MTSIEYRKHVQLCPLLKEESRRKVCYILMLIEIYCVLGKDDSKAIFLYKSMKTFRTQKYFTLQKKIP